MGKNRQSKAMKNTNDSEKEGFLLSAPTYEAKHNSLSFNGKALSWKAGTLPLSYSRSNHIHFIDE
jgi:hypothetical protein